MLEMDRLIPAILRRTAEVKTNIKTFEPVSIVPLTPSAQIIRELPPVFKSTAKLEKKLRRTNRALVAALTFIAGSIGVEKMAETDIPDAFQLSAAAITLALSYSTIRKTQQLDEIRIDPIMPEPWGKRIQIGNPDAPTKIVNEGRLSDEQRAEMEARIIPGVSIAEMTSIEFPTVDLNQPVLIQARNS